ncbi:3-dehydroquinate synthase family protein, partial [Bacteroidota bacterium]
MLFQNIKDKNNNIILGKGCRYHLPDLCSKLNDVSSLIILCDENTKTYCLPLLRPFLENFSAKVHIIELDAGENSKSSTSFNMLIKNLLDLDVDRKSLLINVGGGVITDLGAYVASVFKRGMRFINIPTSLIGQIDAAIGNKSGINFEHLKNILGAFSKPECVIIDYDFLETLPDREFKSAYPEILKYGLVHDVNLYESLIRSCVQDVEENILNGQIIKACVESKIHFVNEDLMDLYERNALNFGHTIGHAIESAYNENGKRILHGEA